MKKINIFIGMLFASTLFFTSCQQDVEVWDSETLDYSGRYVVKLMSEDMQNTLIDYDGREVRIFNTSANVANEVWIDDEEAIFPLKCKFNFTGNPSSFKSTDLDFGKLTNNVYAISLPTVAPTAKDETLEDERDYLRAVIVEGNITPKSVTTKGGNIADGIYMKIKLYSGTATFKSTEKPEKEWKDPEIPEYKWEFVDVNYNAEADETYVLSGYSYTGYPEDEY